MASSSEAAGCNQLNTPTPPPPSPISISVQPMYDDPAIKPDAPADNTRIELAAVSLTH